MTKPYILSPAGSYDALCAAVNAGADEVYFGATSFNARNGAQNFTKDEFADAIKQCRLLGVRTNITVNTLVTDRELPLVCDMVYDAACLGADAFIVQDLGLAAELKRQMPTLELHASTQCACHSLEGAKKLTEYGFTRIVLAREMPLDEIKKVTNAGIEAEIFIHGALCVCHSGMCLMSSVIGKRSGNRGMCAQPCRLPYSLNTDARHNLYPLSLRDLSLSGSVEKLLKSGVRSLKIEGRMKSPEYVYGVTRLWRKLIDEGRSAVPEEMREFEALFSRGGFTDKYFNGTYTNDNRNMYGIRSEEDKRKSRYVNVEQTQKKRPIHLSCRIRPDESISVSAVCGEFAAQYTSDFVCQSAKSAPVSEKEIRLGLSKLGNTSFCASDADIDVDLEGDVFVGKSQLNSVRRAVVEKLEQQMLVLPKLERTAAMPLAKRKVNSRQAQSCFCLRDVDDISIKYVQGQTVVMPLECLIDKSEAVSKLSSDCGTLGVKLPRVAFSSELGGINVLLEKAKQAGATFAVVSNVGMIEAVKNAGLRLCGGIGLNVYNSYTAKRLADDGFTLLTLSPELNSAQMRDIITPENVSIAVVIRGRLPLMVLESCIVRANGSCKASNRTGCGMLSDRKGYNFPVYGEKRMTGGGYPCRNIIYNSVEMDLTSKKEELSSTGADFYITLV